MTSSLTPTEVEEAVKGWMVGQPGHRAFGYRMMTGVEQFWTGSMALSVAGVEEFDRATKCEEVALEVAREFGLGVVMGAKLSEGFHRPAWHMWNITASGQVVDAANVRRVGLGYVGKQMTAWEIERQERLADPFAPMRETAEQVGDLGRGLARMFFG